MIDTDKKQFWLMLNVTMELTNKPPLTKEAIITWWHLLSKYDYLVVEKAIEQWVDSSSKPPTPHDIVGLCKPKDDIYKALPAPIDKEANKIHSKEVVKYIHDNINLTKDTRDWAHKIIANPKRYPDISYRIAREALNII